MKTTKRFPSDEKFQEFTKQVDDRYWLNRLRDAYDAGWEACAASGGRPANETMIVTHVFEAGDDVVERYWDDHPFELERGENVARVVSDHTSHSVLLRWPDGSEDTRVHQALRPATRDEASWGASRRSAHARETSIK